MELQEILSLTMRTLMSVKLDKVENIIEDKKKIGTFYHPSGFVYECYSVNDGVREPYIGMWIYIKEQGYSSGVWMIQKEGD